MCVCVCVHVSVRVLERECVFVCVRVSVCVCVYTHIMNRGSQSVQSYYIINVHVLQAGLTSLVLAVQNQHVEVVEALLNVRCNPNICEDEAVHDELRCHTISQSTQTNTQPTEEKVRFLLLL